MKYETATQVDTHWADPIFTAEEANTLLTNRHIKLIYSYDEDTKALPLGHVMYSEINDELEILSIFVHPPARRRGVAKALIEHMYAPCAGATAQVFLDVRPSNTAALSLYKSLNFKHVRTRAGYYKNPTEDAYVFSLHLPVK